jgi:hypothetical protein
LGLLVAGAVFLMKRLRREDVTDCRIEYEVEEHGVEFQRSETGDDHSEDWSIHGFEDSMESVFDTPTQVVHNMIGHLFGIDRDELF